jgi:hypothetical protein
MHGPWPQYWSRRWRSTGRGSVAQLDLSPPSPTTRKIFMKLTLIPYISLSHLPKIQMQRVREQTENALLHKLLLLHASSTRDAGARQLWTLDETQAFGKRILEASRVKDEASLKLVLFTLEVPKEKVQSLASLLASLTNLEEVVE